MSFTFDSQGTNTYLVYEIGANDELDTMSLGMLTNNTIPGIAAASFTQMDTTKYIKYNVSAKVSVSQLFSGPVNKKRLLGVFSGIVDAMLSAEDYMLDPSSLVMDLDYIFADVSTCETVVICLPVMSMENRTPDLGKFFKNIIFNTQFDQSENCDHVAKILNHLNTNPVFSLNEFKSMLDAIVKEGQAPKAPQPKPVVKENRVQSPVAPAPQPPVAPTVPVPTPKPVQPPVTPTPTPKPVQPQSVKPMNVPPVAPPKQPEPQVPQTTDEKPMSMFYLLQHYSKENAALYKAQQEAKKANKGAASAEKPAKGKPTIGKIAPKAPPKQAAPAGFAIPGQPEVVRPVQNTPVQPPVAPAVGTKPAQPVIQKPNVMPPMPQPTQQGGSISFGETTVLGGAIGETTALGVAPVAAKPVPYLVRSKNNEKIPVNKPVFRIGKERSYVDYFIGDNTAISRSHANIVNHNEEYFVVDTNSTNHTYVNGGMIQSNVEVKLAHGTRIRLANEEFEFKLY